jgi:predicted RNase H-like HicB family nuclease
MNIDYYMRLQYPIIVRQSQYTDGGLCYVAEHPDLPGCRGQGDNPGEAAEDLSESKLLYIQSLIEDGISVPLPSAPLPNPFVVNITTATTSRTAVSTVKVVMNNTRYTGPFFS